MSSEFTSSSPGFIVVSNRGPIEHHLGPGKKIEVKRAGGGVVTALSAVRDYQDFAWIASAITPGDRLVARAAGTRAGSAILEGDRCVSPRLSADGEGQTISDGVHLVVVPRRVFHNHYEVFSNRILWFLQHSMWDVLHEPKDKKTIAEAWWNGYVPANLAFAQAVRKTARHKEKMVVMLHDYHLYLTPGFIRQQSPDAVLQQFVHIPWPSPDAWEAIPAFLRREICRGLLSNDIVGFQTESSVRNFLRCCDQFVDSIEVDYSGRLVRVDNRQVLVRNYPISVNASELRNKMRSPEVRKYTELLRPLCGAQTIVRVDRLEPTKNIPSGFRAFELLLERNPEMVGRLRFLAFLVPSRTGVPEYQQYYREVMDTVNRINSRFARDGVLPIEVLYENNYEQALAGMSLADVVLVNPLADGMNLVAKESVIASAKDSVLVLSREAGAFEQLHRGALGVKPTDVAATVLALEQALRMPRGQRKERHDLLLERVENEDVAWWIESQLKDIDRALAQRWNSRDWQEDRREDLLDLVRLPIKEARSLGACRVPRKN